MGIGQKVPAISEDGEVVCNEFTEFTVPWLGPHLPTQSSICIP